MELIDTHVHLTMPDYRNVDGGVVGVLSRAAAVGVTRCVVPGTNLVDSQQTIELAKSLPEVIAAVGSHPTALDSDLRPFIDLASLPQTKAIGEIGLDINGPSLIDQEKKLRFFLELAAQYHKPVLLHVRDVWDEILPVLEGYPELRGQVVIHCFTGGAREAEAMAAMDILLSVTAIVVRTNMGATLEAIRSWPLEKMMLETDGPWLPWPGESKPNEPKTVVKIAEFVAKLKNISVDEVAEKTSQTACDFFDL